MKIIIRKATEKDLPSIFSMIQEFVVYQRTPEKLTLTLDQLILDKDDFKALVAEADNKEILGFASYYIAYYSWSGKAIYLDDLYVKETARGKNIGTELLKSLIELAKENKYRKVRWQVSRWNENAINFYKKMGASVDDTEMNCEIITSTKLEVRSTK